MHRLIGPSSPTLTLFIVLGAVGTAMSQTLPAPMPAQRPSQRDAPVPIILDAPGSLDALWERLRSPDFVLLRGDRYRELLKAGTKDQLKGDPIVEAVSIRGVVDRRTAELELEFRIACPAQGDAWVPIRLDDLILSSALEQGRNVALRSGVGEGWEAEVPGSGLHTLRVSLTTRVSATGDERRLDVPIPLAGSTTLDLLLRDVPAELNLGPGETLDPVKEPARSGVRVQAALRPRSKFEMRWRIVEQGGEVPSLLGVQGDIAVDAVPDAVRTRSRWSVVSLRGVTSKVPIMIDPEEELLEVELDGRAVPMDATPKPPGSLKISLPEPFRPGSAPHSLIILTRRRIVDGAEANVSIRGAVIGDSSLQGAALGVSQNGSIWVEGTPVRGLQRTDPSNDLPGMLRSRPGTVLAYRVIDRSFELNLRIHPSPPRIEVRTDAIMVLRPGSSSVEARMSFRTTPGRVFEIDFPAMAGEEIETPLPDPAVASSRWKTIDGSNPGTIAHPRVLSIQLTEKARESGVFALTLRTRRPLKLEMNSFDGRWPVPHWAVSLGGRVAVIRTPGIEAKLADRSLPKAGAFSRIEAPKQADWPWPIDRNSELDPSPIWLTYEGQPPPLALDVSPENTTYHSETDLSSYVGRKGVSYLSSVRLEMVGGVLDEFDLLVPAEVEGGWSVDGLDIATRYPVQSDATGQSRYRIVLARKGSRIVTFQLRYSTRFDAPLPTSSSLVGRLAWIRPRLDADGPVRLVCNSEPGVDIEIDPTGWQDLTGDGAAHSSPSGRRFSRRDSPSQLPEFRAIAEPILPLPQLVVSRAYMRTVRGPDELRTTAYFRLASHGESLTIALPDNSRLVRARLDDSPLTEIERPGPDRYRLNLPAATEKAPRVICIESSTGIQPAAWSPPELVGAEVQESYWSVIVPVSQAVIGTPPRWCDDNAWQWKDYVWMKTPLRSESELERWVTGDVDRASDPTGAALAQRTNQHAYLFRKSDGLAPLGVLVLSRSILLVVCSGAVSLAGLGLVLMPARRRPVATFTLAIALALGAARDSDLTLQAILSGVLGFLLTLVAAALQWAVNHRRKGAVGRRFANSSLATAQSVVVPVVANDDADGSTAIRARPPAIIDAFACPTSAPPDAAPSLSEIGVRP